MSDDRETLTTPAKAEEPTTGSETKTESMTKNSSSESSETEEDIARRRRKNRVNAKRSRERKRVVLDTLQQEHWQLHQENKRLKTENDKLREAIDSVKKTQQAAAVAQHHQLGLTGAIPRTATAGTAGTAGSAAADLLGGFLSSQGCHNPTTTTTTTARPTPTSTTTNKTATSRSSRFPSSVNPVVDFLAQQLLLQESLVKNTAHQNPLDMLKMTTGLNHHRPTPSLRGLATVTSPKTHHHQHLTGGMNSVLVDLAYQNGLASILHHHQQRQRSENSNIMPQERTAATQI